jgi:ubiquinone/menaquinone biosynthesis C-methylase UbiE
LNLHSGQTLLDLASGTGTLTALILEERNAQPWNHSDAGAEKRPTRVISVDKCQESLWLAEKFLCDIGVLDRQTVTWIQASANCIPITRGVIDAVIIGNAIQLFENKDQVIREVNRVLRPAGILAFNTSFYAGTFVPGTERFYIRWIEEAIRRIKNRHEDSKMKGLGGIPRKKGLAKPAFSSPWLSKGQYARLLESNGFEVKSVVERTVLLTQRSFEKIGSYAGLAEVLLSGYPAQIGCEALAESVGPALAACNLGEVPRYWIEFVAVKTES